ncbi:hypothetical protein BC628DRAFT_1343761 [Trametes gibbosa]|nr:hypothetical protein BC628DRAFT_1343761 [Trametes gibbosa]
MRSVRHLPPPRRGRLRVVSSVVAWGNGMWPGDCVQERHAVVAGWWQEATRSEELCKVRGKVIDARNSFPLDHLPSLAVVQPQTLEYALRCSGGRAMTTSRPDAPENDTPPASPARSCSVLRQFVITVSGPMIVWHDRDLPRMKTLLDGL